MGFCAPLNYVLRMYARSYTINMWQNLICTVGACSGCARAVAFASLGVYYYRRGKDLKMKLIKESSSPPYANGKLAYSVNGTV